jgi:hypothetical protein
MVLRSPNLPGLVGKRHRDFTVTQVMCIRRELLAFLNSLGLAEFELGVRTACALLTQAQAQAIAAEVGNDDLLASTGRMLERLANRLA